MKSKLFFPALLLAGSFLGTPSKAAAQSTNEVDVITLDAHSAQYQYRPNEIILKFKDSSRARIRSCQKAPSKSGVNAVDAAFRSLGVKRVEALMPLSGKEVFPRKAHAFNGTEVSAPSLDKAFVIEIDEKNSISAAIETLQAVDDIEYAEPNYLIHTLAAPQDINDPFYSVQFGIGAINLYGLWLKPIINSQAPVIAIIDTGVDIAHPDLKNNIWTNEKESAGVTEYDDDNNGYTDDLHGYDFINQTGKMADYNGHGTHCAGIAAATGFNGIGIIGANPQARIMPLSVLQSNGTGDMATIIKAIDYAVANGAQIISMSLGSYAHSTAFEQALGRAYQKAVLIAAAGNDGFCLNHGHPEKGQMAPMPMFPAAYNFVLGVQASNSIGQLAGFSNYDDNGPVFTKYPEEQLYNYELRAPGVGIMSTYPNGQYKRLNGTSMATPLVAGAISRLLQTKKYDNKEELFGDLINSTTPSGNLDILAAYRLTEQNRKPALQFISFDLTDTAGDGDGHADAGETIEIYPILRNAWGKATNIKVKIECAETTNSFAEFLIPEADFGNTLNSYAKARSLNPLKLKIANTVVDGRICRLKLTATADNATPVEQEFEITVENGVEIGGVLKEDMTLHAGVHYIVTSLLGVPSGRTLTIEPGAVIKFKDDTGLSIAQNGHIKAHGTPEKKITFTKTDLGTGKISTFFTSPDYAYSYGDTLKYCILKDLTIFNKFQNQFENSLIDNVHISFIHYTKFLCSNIYNCSTTMILSLYSKNSNITHLKNTRSYISEDDYLCCFNKSYANKIENTNSFSNYDYFHTPYSMACYSESPLVYKSELPNYFGTGRHDIAQKSIYDVNNLPKAPSQFVSFAEYDISNMLTRPTAEAHGIVWKVVVNGYDAQDEFDMLPPLGVGKHKFEIYFNRPMNKKKVPMIAMGVRKPYTQTSISEEGSWNTAGDIYTAYLTITGKQNIDGLNRIYVALAEDNEFFEIPIENTRFNVNVQAAGSLSTGFFGEAGLGRVNLTWQDLDMNFEDIMGYNMYRINPDKNDTILVNPTLIEAGTTTLTDYDVVPGKTYQYYYKVMTTALKENDPSKKVAVTPLTSCKGDANGSGGVDVADVLSSVNFASGLNPKPFIFEAADMNTDLDIDIIDVVGIVNVIIGTPQQSMIQSMAEATLTVENGILYIDSPVDFAGIQFDFQTSHDKPINVLETLNGFEATGSWQNEDTYRFLAYNLNGKTIPAGKHALLNIGEALVTDARMSDPMGNNIKVVFDSPTGIQINDLDRHPMKHALPGIYNVMGVKVGEKATDLEQLPAGVYIVNGWKVMK